jgi:ABC-2 type transport system ATP-binding protein
VAVAVEVDELVVRYGAKTAVDRLSLTVDAGTVTSVLGPNGAGKTTTVETCEGFRRPDAGRVRVLGLDPRADHERLMPRIGVMLQEGGAWSGVRAAEMLRYVARLHAHPLDIDVLVDRLDLGSCGRTPYRRLSGGQKQRLAFALAIVGRPEVAFLDEPTTGLDPHGRREIWQVVRDLRDDGVTVVLTTHAMDEAEQLSDLVHVLSAGTLIASGTPAELTKNGADTLEEVFLRITTPSPRERR